jgi:hypothetical protein
VTLDDVNLLWLRGRAASRKKRSLSETLDEILTEARRGGRGADAARSVVGTIDITGDDLGLDRVDAPIRSLVDESLGRPWLVREAASGSTPPRRKSGTRQARRG